MNDVYEESAQEIEAAVQQVNGTAASPSPFSSLQAFALATNSFLRSQSKLYLYVKSVLTDPAARYFTQDLAEYQKHLSDMDTILRPLREIAQKLAADGISFEVFVMPYEAQLRTNEKGNFLLPQTLVDRFLEKNHIAYFDAFTAFQRSGLPPEALYLYGDPMHLSAQGHRVSFQFAQAELTKLMKARGKVD